MYYIRACIGVIITTISFLCEAEEPPTTLTETLAVIDTIAKSSTPRAVRTANIFDICRTSVAVDARMLAFSVFNRDPTYKGTDAKLAVEVCLAFSDGLPRYVDMDDIARGIANDRLAQLHGDGILFAKDLPFNRQYLAPWAVGYLTVRAREFAKKYQTPLRITSLVRTTLVQQMLAKFGKTPASCKGTPICGTHTTGASFDISLRSLTKESRQWLTDKLTRDMRDGKVLFIIEAKGGHFHVFMPRPKEE